MATVFLLLGSNLGDLEKNLQRACDALEAIGIMILKRSHVCRTKPWGDVAQPDFLNRVIEVHCSFTPAELIVKLKEIERRLGRKPNRRWGPRVIDIDILFYDQRVVQDVGLTIPHPEFFRRSFAIRLMAEVAPDFIPPNSAQCMRDYAREIDNEELTVHCS